MWYAYELYGVHGIPPTRNSVCIFYFRKAYENLQNLCGSMRNSVSLCENKSHALLYMSLI